MKEIYRTKKRHRLLLNESFRFDGKTSAILILKQDSRETGKGERKHNCLDDDNFCSGVAIGSLCGRYIDDMRSDRISCKHFVYSSARRLQRP